MIKTIIIDDELNVRNDIRNRITSYFKNEIIIIGEAASVENGINLIDTLKPELLLLDIEITNGTSFDILANIKLTNFKVIFITGFNEHAIKAIKIGALDYIVKPIDNNEFIEAINKAIKNKNTLENKEHITVSNDYFKGVKNKRIVLKTLETHYIAYEDDIIYCHSEGNYTTFYMNDNKKILISKPMKKVEMLITKAHFIKCHQSYLVNINYIEQYKAEGYLILKNNIKIPIAHRRKEYVSNRLANL